MTGHRSASARSLPVFLATLCACQGEAYPVAGEPRPVEVAKEAILDAQRVEIGAISWYIDYESAAAFARSQQRPLWVHFGENPGCAGCRFFAAGPLRDARVVELSRDFVPVFVDTLDPSQPYARFGESYGSYPVLRVLDPEGHDLARRLDGNTVAGHIAVADVIDQLESGLRAFRAEE